MVAPLLLAASLLSAAPLGQQTPAPGGFLQAIEMELVNLSDQVRRSVVAVEDGRRYSAVQKVDERILHLSRLQFMVQSLSQRERPAGRGKDQTEGMPGVAELERQATEAEAALRAEQEMLQSLPKSGTGFSIGNGYILTTADVLQGMESPVIVTDDGRRYVGRAVAIDSLLNLGTIKLMAKVDIPAVRWGVSDSVRPGQFAIAVGSLGGTETAISIGTVGSVKKEPVLTFDRLMPGVIQLTGAIGSGGSGAPLLNSRGEVIGIVVAVPFADVAVAGVSGQSVFTGTARPPAGGGSNKEPASPGAGAGGSTGGGGATAKDVAGSPTTAGTGTVAVVSGSSQRMPRSFTSSVGYAIPSDGIRRYVDELVSGKRIAVGWLGVSAAQNVSQSTVAGQINVTTTVYFAGVYRDSPAWLAGIRPGDEIRKLDGIPMRTMADLRSVTARVRAGDVMMAEMVRDSKPFQVTLKIAAKPVIISQMPEMMRPAQPENGFDPKKPKQRSQSDGKPTKP